LTACRELPFTLARAVERISSMAEPTGWRLRAGSADDARACLDIIAGLPEFFTPDTGDKVGNDLIAHDSWVITDGSSVSGFAIVKRRSPAAAEILWAAITPTRRHQGIGTSLIERVLDRLRTGGTTLVEVKTLDPSAGYPPYTATYRFWTTRGFIHVDTIDPLPGWEPGNPCAILVAPLASSR
jgi:GNAT superfamily N-acetyltransferase